MAQFGNSTITNTIVPFLADTVLGNIEKDKLLQKAIGFKSTITELDKQTIIGLYTKKTTSVIATDSKFKKVFWSEFFTWIETQKKIAGSDPLVLSKRLLPVNPEGGYYKEAFRNFNKFGFQATKAYEFSLINEKIDEKFGPNSADARNEKFKLKNGDLVLLKKKDGKYDYFAKQEIRKALESVKKAAELYNRVQIIKEGNNTYMVSFNPLKPTAEGQAEARSTILDVNKEIWANKNYLIQTNLEQKVGLHFDGVPSVGENGVLSGIVIDLKTKKQLKVEVNLANPVENRTYRFTFTNAADKGKNFSLKDNELDYFKDYSPKEILGIKQGGEHKREELPVSIVGVLPKKEEQPSAGQPATITSKKVKGSEPIKSQLDQPTPVEPPVSGRVTQGYRNSNRFNNLQLGEETLENTGGLVGPMSAKEGFKSRLRIKRTVPSAFRPKKKGGNVFGTRPMLNLNGGKQKNPVLQLVKWHLLGMGAGGGILGFLTTTNIIPLS